MDRTSATNYVTNAGLRQYQDKNPVAGTRGTTLAAADRNAIQEELIHGLIEAAGIEPSNSVWTQVGQAVRRLAPSYATPLAASATLTLDQMGLVLVNATAGNVVITLPAAAAISGVALRFRFVRTDTSANTVTLAAAGSDTFTNLYGSAISAPAVVTGAALDVISDGVSKWVASVQSAGGNLIGVQEFTSSGTYTPTPGMNFCIAEMVPGGPGGGGAAATTSTTAAAGGPGFAGLQAVGRFTAAQIGASQPVTIGTGGAGGSAGNHAGGTGGTTSLGSLMSATGNSGGAGAPANAAYLVMTGSASGSSSTVTGANLRSFVSPGFGFFGISSGGVLAQGGNGTNSPYGQGGFPSNAATGTAVNGNAAGSTNYGAGGGGGASNDGGSASGGAGAGAFMRIWEYS